MRLCTPHIDKGIGQENEEVAVVFIVKLHVSVDYTIMGHRTSTVYVIDVILVCDG